MDIYDASKDTGNCYTGCAYLCYRKRRCDLTSNKFHIIDFRFSAGSAPRNGYYFYCPKNPVTGFDIIEKIQDDQNLLKGMFHTNFIIDKDTVCPCFESKFGANLYSQIQCKVSEYERI